MCKYF
jgi:hypothetical protein